MPGGGAPKRRGARYENELANLLWERGYAVVRGPASGGGVTRRFQPDLVAMHRGRILVFEIKSTRPGGRIYVDGRRVMMLEEFAKRSGGQVFVAVKTIGEGWRFYPIEELEQTPGGNYRVPPRGGLRLRELEAVLGLVRSIDEYIDGANARMG